MLSIKTCHINQVSGIHSFHFISFIQCPKCFRIYSFIVCVVSIDKIDFISYLFPLCTKPKKLVKKSSELTKKRNQWKQYTRKRWFSSDFVNASCVAFFLYETLSLFYRFECIFVPKKTLARRLLSPVDNSTILVVAATNVWCTLMWLVLPSCGIFLRRCSWPISKVIRELLTNLIVCSWCDDFAVVFFFLRTRK